MKHGRWQRWQGIDQDTSHPTISYIVSKMWNMHHHSDSEERTVNHFEIVPLLLWSLALLKIKLEKRLSQIQRVKPTSVYPTNLSIPRSSFSSPIIRYFISVNAHKVIKLNF